MTKRTFLLIDGIVAGVAGIAEALANYFQPPFLSAINSLIPIIATAVASGCGLFVANGSSSAGTAEEKKE